MGCYGVVYKHVNKLNGKVYVGQTCQDVERCFRKNSKKHKGYKNSTAFYNAIKKYGWDNFETTILVSCTNQDDLNYMKEYFINYYNSVVPNGYNSLAITNNKVVYPQPVRTKISKARKKYFSLGEHVAFNRNHHKFDNGVELKQCSKCEEWKTLDKYGKYKVTWDGLNRYCKECNAIISREYRKENPYKRLPEDEYKRRMKLRGEKNADKLRLYYKNNPEGIKRIREQNCKPIKGINTETQEVICFKSALQAKEKGFDNSQISLAIRKGKPYKGYLWFFDKK